MICGASGSSYNGGERSVLAGQGRARTCCCFSRSMFTSLTPLREPVNLAPFVVHISSSGGAAMSKALDIVRRAAYTPTIVLGLRFCYARACFYHFNP